MSSTTPGSVRASSVTTALMKNYAAATAFSAEHGFAVVQDERGEPLVFAIGVDRRLRVVHRDADSPTGWREQDLSRAMGDGLEVSTFAVSQDPTRALAVVAAAHPPGAPDQAEVYVARPSRDPDGRFEWQAVGTAWTWARRTPTRGPSRVTRIILGTAAAGEAPLALVAVERDGQAWHDQIAADPAATGDLAAQYPLPEDATRILDLTIGFMRGTYGVYTLYEVGKDTSLQFIGLPDPEYPTQRVRVPFALRRGDAPIVGARVVAVRSAPKRPGERRRADDLFVAGDFGVVMFRESGGGAVAVAGEADVGKVERLLVRSDEDTVALWALDRTQHLRYLSAGLQDTSRWSLPIALAVSASHVGALRSWSRKANELFVLKNDNTLERRFQDPVTTRWETQAILLPDSGKTVEFNCYTSEVALTNAGGGPAAGARTRVRASEWTQVTINGSTYVLDPERRVEVEADVEGMLTFLQPVSSLASCQFYVECDGLAEEVVVNPMADLFRRLRAMKGGDDLAQFKSRDGRTLGDKLSGEQRARAVEMLRGLAAATDALSETDAVSFAVGEPVRSVRYTMDLSGGAVTFSGGEAEGEELSFGIVDDIVAAAGDVLEAVVSGIVKAAKFTYEIVGKVLEFQMWVLGKWIKFVVTTWSTIGKAINWVIKEAFGIDLFDEIVGFVGNVLPWDDIILTHEVLVQVVNQGLDDGAQAIADTRQAVDEWFGSGRQALRQNADALKQRLGPVGQQSLSAALRGVAGRDKADTAASSPGVGIARYHFKHSMSRTGDAGAAAATPAPDDVLAQLNEDLREVGGKLMTLVGDLASALGAAFADMTINEILDRTVEAMDSGIDLVQTIVYKLFQWVERLIALLKKYINEPIELPVISTLYKKHIGSDMTPLDAVVLLLAIPVTLVYKAATGRPPFARGPAAEADEADLSFGTESQGKGVLQFSGIIAASGVALGVIIKGVCYMSHGFARSLEKIGEQLSLAPKTRVVQKVMVGVALIKSGLGLYGVIKGAGASTAITVLRSVRTALQVVGIGIAVFAHGDPTGMRGKGLKIVSKTLDLPLSVALGVMALGDHWSVGGKAAAVVDGILIVVSLADVAGVYCDHAQRKDLAAIFTAASMGVGTILAIVPLAMEFDVLPECL